MARRERRLEPFADEHARDCVHLGECCLDAPEARPHPARQLVRRRLLAEALTESGDGREHSVERPRRHVDRLDVEATRAHELVHFVARDRAHVAELLHEHDVGLDLAPRVLVDRVEGTAVDDCRGDGAVDLDARGPSLSMSDAVTDGLVVASCGQSHSCVTPTTRSPRPSAKTISVAPGTSEQIFTKERTEATSG